jgi:RHS repeat-associated protein
MVSYAYDQVGNLTSAALPQASANFSYNGRNQIASINRLNGVTSSFTYDDDARVLSLAHAKGASLIDTENYTYDLVGNRASHSTTIGQSPGTQSTVNQFGNANELILFGSLPNSYDANGNLVQDGTATYTWDGRNRLKSIVNTAGQTTAFTYDFAGNLIQQADSGASLTLTRAFLLDSLTNIVYESASDGSSYDVLSGQSLDSHMAIVQPGVTAQYGLNDAINSTVAVVDQNGGILSQFLYEPYGKTTATGTYAFRYAGRLPVSSGLYYNRARFYNSQTGRFISEDPISADWNRYRYVGNSPTNRLDPTGLASAFVFYFLEPEVPAGNIGGAATVFEHVGLFGADTNSGLFYGRINAIGGAGELGGIRGAVLGGTESTIDISTGAEHREAINLYEAERQIPEWPFSAGGGIYRSDTDAGLYFYLSRTRGHILSGGVGVGTSFPRWFLRINDWLACGIARLFN